MTFATSPEALERHAAEVLNLVRAHIEGKHNGPEDYQTECLACDHYRLDVEGERLAGERDQARAEMAAVEQDRDQLRERLDGDAWERLNATLDQHRRRADDAEDQLRQRDALYEAVKPWRELQRIHSGRRPLAKELRAEAAIIDAFDALEAAAHSGKEAGQP